jgi:hypothetical protein
MATGRLFGADLGTISNASSTKAARGKPRLVRADRRQLRLESRSLDELIAYDHRARTLWLASAKLDLSTFYDEIEALEASPGRPAIDPRILLVLWLYDAGRTHLQPAESLGDRAGSLVAEYDVRPVPPAPSLRVGRRSKSADAKRRGWRGGRLFRSEQREPNGGWCRPRRMRLDAVVLSRAIPSQPVRGCEEIDSTASSSCFAAGRPSNHAGQR